jgi:hypothetical protein
LQAYHDLVHPFQKGAQEREGNFYIQGGLKMGQDETVLELQKKKEAKEEEGDLQSTQTVE